MRRSRAIIPRYRSHVIGIDDAQPVGLEYLRKTRDKSPVVVAAPEPILTTAILLGGDLAEDAFLLGEGPQHVDEAFREGVEIDVELALLDVVAHPALLALVVVHHLDHLQQIILAQLLQTLRQLVHINALGIAALLLLGNAACADLGCALLAGIGTVGVAGDGTGAAETFVEGSAGFGVLEDEDVLGLILVLLEVEVVDHLVGLA